MTLPTPDPDIDTGHEEVGRGAAEQSSGTPPTETERQMSQPDRPRHGDDEAEPAG